MPRSSRGLGRRPFTAVARVQIPYAVQVQCLIFIWNTIPLLDLF